MLVTPWGRSNNTPQWPIVADRQICSKTLEGTHGVLVPRYGRNTHRYQVRRDGLTQAPEETEGITLTAAQNSIAGTA